MGLEEAEESTARMASGTNMTCLPGAEQVITARGWGCSEERSVPKGHG